MKDIFIAEYIAPGLNVTAWVPGVASSATSNNWKEFSEFSFRTPRSTQVTKAFRAELRSTNPTRGMRPSKDHTSINKASVRFEWTWRQGGCFTFLWKKLNESSFQWCYVGRNLSILELELQVNRAEMRQPAKFLVWLEGRKFLGVLGLKSANINERTGKENLSWHKTYLSNWPGITMSLDSRAGQKCRDIIVGCIIDYITASIKTYKLQSLNLRTACWDWTCWSIRFESVISLNITSHTCSAVSPNRIFRISIFRRW